MRAGRAKQPEYDRSISHLAAASSHLLLGTSVSRASHGRDADTLLRNRRGNGGVHGLLRRIRSAGGPLFSRAARHSRPGKLRAPEHLESDLRVIVLGLGIESRANMARATETSTSCRVGSHS